MLDGPLGGGLGSILFKSMMIDVAWFSVSIDYGGVGIFFCICFLGADMALHCEWRSFGPSICLGDI
jgi:hypothetical protein